MLYVTVVIIMEIVKRRIALYKLHTHTHTHTHTHVSHTNM